MYAVPKQVFRSIFADRTVFVTEWTCFNNATATATSSSIHKSCQIEQFSSKQPCKFCIIDLSIRVLLCDTLSQEWRLCSYLYRKTANRRKPSNKHLTTSKIV